MIHESGKAARERMVCVSQEGRRKRSLVDVYHIWTQAGGSGMGRQVRVVG